LAVSCIYVAYGPPPALCVWPAPTAATSGPRPTPHRPLALRFIYGIYGQCPSPPRQALLRPPLPWMPGPRPRPTRFIYMYGLWLWPAPTRPPPPHARSLALVCAIDAGQRCPASSTTPQLKNRGLTGGIYRSARTDA
jgi:hypothetical protein